MIITKTIKDGNQFKMDRYTYRHWAVLAVLLIDVNMITPAHNFQTMISLCHKGMQKHCSTISLFHKILSTLYEIKSGTYRRIAYHGTVHAILFSSPTCYSTISLFSLHDEYSLIKYQQDYVRLICMSHWFRRWFCHWFYFDVPLIFGFDGRETTV